MKKHIKHFFMGIVTLLPAVAGGFGVATLFGSCADDEPIGDPEKAWAETTDVFESADEQSFSTFYTPSIGRVGDPMPFYDKKAGNFKVLPPLLGRHHHRRLQLHVDGRSTALRRD